MNSRIRTPFYIFFLNLDYVAAHTLRLLRSKNSLTGMRNLSYFSETRRNLISTNTNKMLMPVSEVCVSAVYNLASMYFISFACSVGTTKFCRWKSDKTIILLMRKLRQILYRRLIHAFSFFSIIIIRAFVN